MAPSNIHEKTPDVSLMAYGRCGRAECVPPSALGPCYSASGLLPKPPHGGPGVEPNPSRHACRSLPSSALNHSAAGLSACLIMHHAFSRGRQMIQLSSSGRPPSGAPARRGRRLMRRTSRGVWHSRSTANTKKKGWHPEFEAKNRNPDESAPVAL